MQFWCFALRLVDDLQDMCREWMSCPITHFDCPALKHNLNISSGFKTAWKRNPKSAQKNGKFQF